MSRRRLRRAFSLLELVVVLVVLGLLATLAIPTFSHVLDRSRDATTSATLSSVLRDAQALRRLDPELSWDDAATAAVAETMSPVGPYRAQLSLEDEPDEGQVVHASNDEFLALALRSPSGLVCVATTSLELLTVPSCAAPPPGPLNSVATVLESSQLRGSLAGLLVQ